MKLGKRIRRLLKLPIVVRQNQENLKDIEERIFRPKKKDETCSGYLSQMMDFYMWGSGGGRSISLEEKIDAIAKHLKIGFEMTREKESEVIAKKKRKPRKKKAK